MKDIEWQVKDGQLELIDPSIDAATAKATNDENFEAAKEVVKEDENAEWPAYNKYVIVSPEVDEEDENAEEMTEEEILENSYVLLNMNKGKTWIGWVSRNNGGSVSSR